LNIKKLDLPLVSIITPSFNQARYLEQTIKSVISQGYPNLEYIIIDGGSKDGSVDIIRKYADQLTYWISEPDNGQGEAINKGFTRARGEIVSWLNSDDLYAPDAISQAVEVLTGNPELGMVYGNAVTIDQYGRPLNDLEFHDWGLEDLIIFEMICQPAVFMRYDALEQAGFLDTSYDFLLDYHLWLRIAQLKKIRYIPKIMAFSRHHPMAKNVCLAPKFGEEAFRILDWMYTQPNLEPLVSRNRRRILAAAHRFNARYLLDGDHLKPSLKSYLQALFTHPGTALREWHRIIFAILSLVGGRKLRDVYYKLRQKRLPLSMRIQGIDNVQSLYSSQQPPI